MTLPSLLLSPVLCHATISGLSFLRQKRTTDLPGPGGRARLHVRHFAPMIVAFADTPGCNDDGKTKDETCAGKAVQDQISSRAFLRLCHVIAANYKTNEARWLRVPTTESKNGPRRDEWAPPRRSSMELSNMVGASTRHLFKIRPRTYL